MSDFLYLCMKPLKVSSLDLYSQNSHIGSGLTKYWCKRLDYEFFTLVIIVSLF